MAEPPTSKLMDTSDEEDNDPTVAAAADALKQEITRNTSEGATLETPAQTAVPAVDPRQLKMETPMPETMLQAPQIAVAANMPTVGLTQMNSAPNMIKVENPPLQQEGYVLQQPTMPMGNLGPQSMALPAGATLPVSMAPQQMAMHPMPQTSMMPQQAMQPTQTVMQQVPMSQPMAPNMMHVGPQQVSMTMPMQMPVQTQATMAQRPPQVSAPLMAQQPQPGQLVQLPQQVSNPATVRQVVPMVQPSQVQPAGQPALQLADILNLLHASVPAEKWGKISQVVNQIKESTKSTGVNDTDSKRKLLQSIRDIAGIDLWNKVVMRLHQQGAQGSVGPSMSGGNVSQNMSQEQMQLLQQQQQAKQQAQHQRAQQVTASATHADQYQQRQQQQMQQRQQQQMQQQQQLVGQGSVVATTVPHPQQRPSNAAQHPQMAVAGTVATSGQHGSGAAAAPPSGSRPQPTVGQVINAVKRFVRQEDHSKLENLQEQYLSRAIDKKQLEQKLRQVAGDNALRQAIASLFPRGSSTAPPRDNSMEAKQLVAHAYKCRNNQCQYGKKCFETKLKLQQLARHAQQCTNNSNSSTSANQCRLCRMWKYVQQMSMQGGAGGSAMPINPMPDTKNSGAPPGGSKAGTARIREADPAVLRKLALEHMSKCNGCDKCNRLREKMRAQQNLKMGNSNSSAAGSQRANARGPPPTKRRKTQPSTSRGTPRGGAAAAAADDTVRNPQEIDARGRPEEPLNPGDRVEVMVQESQHRPGGPTFCTAKVLDVRPEDNSMDVQFAGQIGTAFAIAGYDTLPVDSPLLRKYVDTGKDQEIPVEEGNFGAGFLVEVKVPTRNGTSCNWQNAEIQSVTREGQYIVELDGEQQIQASRSELRAVCNHQLCRLRALVFELPQLYCVKCKVALRVEGACYYQESDDAAESCGGGRGIQICHLCFSEIRNKGKQKAPTSLWRTIGRAKEFDLDSFQEIRVPKQGNMQKLRGTKIECAPFIRCDDCGRWYHWVCALYNDAEYQLKKWNCHICRERDKLPACQVKYEHTASPLAQTRLSKAIDASINKTMAQHRIKHPEVVVRVVSMMRTAGQANPEMVNFDWSDGEDYPREFPYTSTAIMAFQKVEGYDVCIFAMYTQEYYGDCPEPNKWHLYISYLDSVRYFQSTPSNKRTLLYHAILLGYLQHMRKRGFRFIHIWVEPPKQGDEYIFFARPAGERKAMTREKLRSWYEVMLQTAIQLGIVEDMGSLLYYYKNITSVRQIPCFHGDLIESTLAAVLEKEKERIKTTNNQMFGDDIRIDSQSILAKTQEELAGIDSLFLVARFRPLNHDEPQDTVENPLILNAATNFREAFVGKSQTNHWQFNNLHWAKYSTMMLLHCLHTSPKPTYCLPNCKRGRAEDDSFMICCDQCEQWYHGECVGVTKAEADAMGRYKCMSCSMMGDGGDDGGLGGLGLGI